MKQLSQKYYLNPENDKQRGLLLSLVLHILLFLLALMPYFSSVKVQKSLPGIMIAFGEPESGASENDPTTDDISNTNEVNPSGESSSEDKKNAKSIVKDAKKESETKSEKSSIEVDPVEDIAEVSVNKTTDDVDDETSKQAAKQIKEKAAQEEKDRQAKYEASKSQFEKLFGSGKGDNHKSGKQGDPEGNPNSDALEGIAKGSLRVSGGLSDRGVLYEPEVQDQSQKYGKVKIKVCVDASGKVIETKYTQRGSTTTDADLINIAKKAASEYRFTPSENEIQCGVITFDFKLV